MNNVFEPAALLSSGISVLWEKPQNHQQKT
jgi:hypothetical protein